LGKSGRLHCRSRICACALGLCSLYRPCLSLRQRPTGHVERCRRRDPASGSLHPGASSILVERHSSARGKTWLNTDRASYRGAGQGGTRMKKYLDAARPLNGHTLVSFRATTFELPWPQKGRASGWTSWGTTAVAHTTVCAVGATARAASWRCTALPRGQREAKLGEGDKPNWEAP
jgi:hypothetical protein